MVFLHLPFEQSVFIILHSFISAEKKMADENQRPKEPRRSLAGGGSTFEEGSAVEEVTPVRETWATGAELVVVRSASLGAFVTFRPPSHAHRAAAGIHAVPP